MGATNQAIPFILIVKNRLCQHRADRRIEKYSQQQRLNGMIFDTHCIASHPPTHPDRADKV